MPHESDDEAQGSNPNEGVIELGPDEALFAVGEHGLRLVPSMSDQFYRLARNLATTAADHPGDISIPAGVVVIAAAALEAYVNELVEIIVPEGRRAELTRFDTNLVAKLRWLRDNAADPPSRPRESDALTEEILADVILLYGLRGELMHYAPQPEHPVATTTSLQRLLRRFPRGIVRELQTPSESGEVPLSVSLSRLLTPELANWACEVLEATIKAIYRIGWEVPRPRWLTLVRST